MRVIDMSTQEKTFRKFRLFWAWEDDREESWLREMSLQGNHMKKVIFPGIYTFETGKPKDYIYRLDYAPEKFSENYLNLFHDAGWSYLGNLNYWQYFRKEVLDNDVPEIFTDNDSKAKKYRQLIAMLSALLPLMVVNVINCGSRADQPFWLGLTLFFVVFLVVFVLGIIKLLKRVNQLKQL